MTPKKEEGPQEAKYLEEIVLFFLVLLFLWEVWLRIRVLWDVASLTTIWGHVVAWAVAHLWPFVKAVGVLVGSLAVVGSVYNFRKRALIAKEERGIYHPELDDTATPDDVKNSKWERVIEHINSPNAAEWRLAIIEADVMLEELLRTQGYHGDSIGEMLKGVEPSDMLMLDNAWEAHKVRSQIAHAGSDFELTERDAKRVVMLYESVFREFKII